MRTTDSVRVTQVPPGVGGGRIAPSRPRVEPRPTDDALPRDAAEIARQPAPVDPVPPLHAAAMSPPSSAAPVAPPPPPAAEPPAPPEPVQLSLDLGDYNLAPAAAPPPPPLPAERTDSLMPTEDWNVAGAADPPYGTTLSRQYPGYRPIQCATRDGCHSADWDWGASRAQVDVAYHPEDPRSVWDQSVLQRNPAVARALQGYMNGDVAASLRDLDLANKTPEQIHFELTAKGFIHCREPLSAGVDPGTGKPLYLRRDGQRTLDAHDPQVVPHDIYVNPDGGMVRVKPEGAPGNKFRPEPHVSKGVLLEHPWELFFLPDDAMSFDNEAFKVTNQGAPVPKAAWPKVGMKMPEKTWKQEQKNGYLDAIMSLAHTNLPLSAG